jgi:hypothetical protein
MEQERPRQEETIKKLTGKCSYKIKLYNNTPTHTIVNAVSYISYRTMKIGLNELKKLGNI